MIGIHDLGGMEGFGPAVRELDAQGACCGHWHASLERLAVGRGLITAGEYAPRVPEHRSGERDGVF